MRSSLAVLLKGNGCIYDPRPSSSRNVKERIALPTICRFEPLRT